MPTEESEAKAKTKARFEEVFRSYAELTSEGKRSKKKSRPLPEQIELETLQNKLDFAKETDNVILKNIMYDPEERNAQHTKKKLKAKSLLTDVIQKDAMEEERKQKKSTKKKTRVTKGEEFKTEESMLQTVLHNFGGEGDKGHIKLKNKLEQDGPVPKVIRKKLRSAIKDEQYQDTLEEDEQQLIQAYQLQVSEDEANEIRAKMRKKLMQQKDTFTVETDSQEVEMGRKKKKKEMAEVPEAETSVMSISELQGAKEHSSKTKSKEGMAVIEKLMEEEDAYQQNSKGKKAKKKTKRENNSKIVSENAQANNMYLKRSVDESHVLGIYIHRTDKLKTDLLISHPTVKIHVIDEKTGLYVKKETSHAILSEQEKVEHVLPIMTKLYDFRQNKSALPQWEEQIVLSERLGYLLQETEDGPKVILFFELLDVLSLDDTRFHSEVQIQERSFRKIAWAFLKLVGANGVLNVDGKLRLQLYYPPSRYKAQLSTVDVFEWWLKCPRNRYPSTLYVTVKGLKPPDQVGPSRSMLALQHDHGDSQSTPKSNELGTDEKRPEFVKWTRFPGQACRIPNKHLFSLRAGQQGCFSICFSHDGRTLAAACANRDEYPVYLYEIPSGQYLQELHGHLNIVYDICWSRDDQTLLTASSDGTARMWKLEAQTTSALKVLPHPSFVYTAKFHPVADYLVATGCYDSVVRVWNVTTKEINGQLLQELDGHKSFINTICFDDEGINMFSGDSSGLIIVWNTFVTESSQENPALHWCIKKEIRETDLKGISVNFLDVHPNGRRLLIHAKDSTLRVMDLRILATKKYIGATNYREKIQSALTPCGTFLFSGSEDGLAYVWNTETGDQVAKYSDLSYTSPLRDVAFHPHEHMVAFCAFGQSQPILVYIYDHKVSQLEAESIKDLSGSFKSAAVRRAPLSNGSDATTTQHDQFIVEADQFVSTVRSSMRLQKVKQKLDSVMDSAYLSEQFGVSPSGTWNVQKEYRVGSPISSSTLYPTSSNLSLPAPSLLSPHSKLRLPGTLASQLIPHQSLTPQGGSFSPVGRPVVRSPSFKLQMSGNESSATSLKLEADRYMPVQETVVALYDYTAHRSDELTIHRSDIIQVLYKDNDSWWFGCLANGQQGYFPANYVVGETSANYEDMSDDAHLIPVAHADADGGSPSSQRQMLPSNSKSREQQFIPQPDTETNPPMAQGTNQKKKKTQNVDRIPSSLLAEPHRPQESAGAAGDMEGLPEHNKRALLKKKKKKSPKNSDTAGTSNNAFESDSYHA